MTDMCNALALIDPVGLVPGDDLRIGRIVKWNTDSESLQLTDHEIDLEGYRKVVEPYAQHLHWATKDVVAFKCGSSVGVEGAGGATIGFVFNRDNSIVYDCEGVCITRSRLASDRILTKKAQDLINRNIYAFKRFQWYGIIVSIITARHCNLVKGDKGQQGFSATATAANLVGIHLSNEIRYDESRSAAQTYRGINDAVIGIHLRRFKLNWWDKQVQVDPPSLGTQTAERPMESDPCDGLSDPDPSNADETSHFAGVVLDSVDPLKTFDKLDLGILKE